MRTIPLLSLLFVVGAAGCWPAAHPVDPDQARDVLRHVLDRWKEGAKPAALRDESPEIVVQDPDWAAGRELGSYTLDGDGTPLDANLHQDVELVLRAPDGEETTKTVTYLVGTDPVLTVFRKMSM